MKHYNILFWHCLYIDDIVIDCETIYQALEKFKSLHGNLDDLIQIKIFND